MDFGVLLDGTFHVPRATGTRTTLTSLVPWRCLRRQYMVVSFFLLLNALLAIIVEAYDKVKSGIQEGQIDVLMIMWADLKGNFRSGQLHVSSQTMQAFVTTAVNGLFMEQMVDTPAAKAADAQKEMTKVVDRLHKHPEKAKFATSTIFYVMPGGTIEQQTPMVLDLDMLASVFALMLDSSDEVGLVLAWNILQCYGVDVDRNGDGKIDKDEIAAFKDIFKLQADNPGQGRESGKARLIALIA